MADKVEGEETAPRGADWEVVSLTASAYAAAPGPDTAEFKDDAKDDVVDRDKGETSNPLFMSGHFVFPPNQHENLPLEPEVPDEQGGEDVSEYVEEEGGKSDAKDEENWNLKKLAESDEFHGIPFFDEKGNMVAISEADFAESTALQGLSSEGKGQSIYSATKFHSFHNEETMGTSVMDDDNGLLTESVESSDPALGDIPNQPKHTEEDDYDGSPLPFAAWWKKQAASLYAHAKEANTFWSIFIAAAVMGLVILGQQWQQERWQVLQNKWQFGITDERMGRMLGPLSRFKDALVGGNRRGFAIRGSNSGER